MVSYVDFPVVVFYFHLVFASDSEIEVLSNIDDSAPTEGIPCIPSEHEDDNVKKAKKGKAHAQAPPSSPRLQQPVAAQSSSGSRATKDRSLSKSSKNIVMSYVIVFFSLAFTNTADLSVQKLR